MKKKKNQLTKLIVMYFGKRKNLINILTIPKHLLKLLMFFSVNQMIVIEII